MRISRDIEYTLYKRADMARNGVVLVVPESLKSSKEAVYEKQDEVITSRDFFHDQIRARRPALLLAG